MALAIVLMSASTRGAAMGGYLTSMSRGNGSVVESVRDLPVIKTFNRTGETVTETRTRSAPRDIPGRPDSELHQLSHLTWAHRWSPS